MASVDFKGGCKLWDVKKQKEAATHNVSTTCFSMQWNYDGSLLGFLNKDKNFLLLDPR